jgi:hypothetical protein
MFLFRWAKVLFIILYTVLSIVLHIALFAFANPGPLAKLPQRLKQHQAWGARAKKAHNRHINTHATVGFRALKLVSELQTGFVACQWSA